MATDVVTIWNLALSAVGSRSLISAEDEVGKPADLCRLWYPLVRDNVLKAASWPSANKWATLGLLAERDFGQAWTDIDPAPGWKYAYTAPTDMLAPRHLSNYARFDRGLLGDTNVILTNQKQAVLHYTMNQTDVTRWDSGLEATVVDALAAKLALPISGKRTLAEYYHGMAENRLLLSSTESANESDDLEEVNASWINARGYAQLPGQNAGFVWPYEQLNGVAT